MLGQRHNHAPRLLAVVGCWSTAAGGGCDDDDDDWDDSAYSDDDVYEDEYEYEYEEDDSSPAQDDAVSSSLRWLRSRYQGNIVPLHALDDALAELHETHNVSMTTIARVGARWHVAGRGAPSAGPQGNGLKAAASSLPQEWRATQRLPRLHPAHAPTTQVVRNRGICLSTCEEYGSPAALRAALREDPGLLVPLYAAKDYFYAKQCLIRL